MTDSRAWRARAVSSVLSALLLALAPAASADDSDDAAKAAFDAGSAAEKHGDWVAAAEHYQRAYTFKPHPFALFNVARAYQRAGQPRLAGVFFQRYLDEAPDASDRAEVARTLDSLRAAPGRLRVTASRSGVAVKAAVTIDGELRGTTPLEINIGGGAHQLALSVGDLSTSRGIVTGFGEALDVEVDVASRPATLSVRGNVDGAAISIDGQAVGAIPLITEFTAGLRHVEVSSPGYLPQTQDIELRAGGSASLVFLLPRDPTTAPPPAPPTPDRNTFVVGVRAFRSVDETQGIWLALGRRRTRAEFSTVVGAMTGGFYLGIQAASNLAPGRVAPTVDLGIGYLISDGSALYGYADAGIAIRDVLPSDNVRTDLRLTVGLGALFAADTDLTIPLSATIVFSPR